MEQSTSTTHDERAAETGGPVAPPPNAVEDIGNSWWLWRLLWGVSFAAPVFCILMAGSSDDLGDGASAAEGWMTLALISMVVLLLLSGVMGYFTFRFEHALRNAGWWLLTTVLAVAGAIGLWLPFSRPSEQFDPSIDSEGTVLMSVVDQLKQLPFMILLLCVVAFVGALPGVIAALIARYRARNKVQS